MTTSRCTRRSHFICLTCHHGNSCASAVDILWTQALLEAAAATPGSLVRGVDVPAAVTWWAGGSALTAQTLPLHVAFNLSEDTLFAWECCESRPILSSTLQNKDSLREKLGLLGCYATWLHWRIMPLLSSSTTAGQAFGLQWCCFGFHSGFVWN